MNKVNSSQIRYCKKPSDHNSISASSVVLSSTDFYMKMVSHDLKYEMQILFSSASEKVCCMELLWPETDLYICAL